VSILSNNSFAVANSPSAMLAGSLTGNLAGHYSEAQSATARAVSMRILARSTILAVKEHFVSTEEILTMQAK
jgi:hypothetical protein